VENDGYIRVVTHITNVLRFFGGDVMSPPLWSWSIDS